MDIYKANVIATAAMPKHKARHERSGSFGSSCDESEKEDEYDPSLRQWPDLEENDVSWNLVDVDTKKGTNCGCPISAKQFDVRGKNYINDRKKKKSDPSKAEFVHAEFFRDHHKRFHAASRPGSFLRAQRKKGDNRHYFVVQFIAPNPPYHHMVCYYALDAESKKQATADGTDPNSSFWRLWNKFAYE